MQILDLPPRIVETPVVLDDIVGYRKALLSAGLRR
jgi:hypothetical protein